MAENSNIGWTHHTFNPWRGCQHAVLADGSEHPACLDCYAEIMSGRNPTVLGEWGADGVRVMAAAQYWKLPRKWNRDAEKQGERVRVFCASLADVFEDWPGVIHDHQGRVVDGLTLDDLRCELFDLIDQTPWINWLLLTKRPENIRRMWPAKKDKRPIFPGAPGGLGEPLDCMVTNALRPNVWLITSVSNQQTFDQYSSQLGQCGGLAPVLGFSVEPILGYVDMHMGCWRPDWVIVGGLSGSRWQSCGDVTPLIANIAEQCADRGIPCYVKQDAARLPGQQGRIPTAIWNVKQFPQAEAAHG